MLSFEFVRLWTPGIRGTRRIAETIRSFGSRIFLPCSSPRGVFSCRLLEPGCSCSTPFFFSLRGGPRAGQQRIKAVGFRVFGNERGIRAVGLSPRASKAAKSDESRRSSNHSWGRRSIILKVKKERSSRSKKTTAEPPALRTPRHSQPHRFPNRNTQLVMSTNVIPP